MSPDETQEHSSSGWQQWSQYVLKAVERDEAARRLLDCRIRKLETEMAIQKTKMMVYAGVGGGIIAAGIKIAEILWP